MTESVERRSLICLCLVFGVAVVILGLGLNRIDAEAAQLTSRINEQRTEASRLGQAEEALQEAAKARLAAHTSNAAAAAKPTLRNFTQINALGDPDAGPYVARRMRLFALSTRRQAFDALHLSAEKSGALKRLLAERYIAWYDASDVVDRMESSDDADKLRQASYQESKNAIDEKIKALIGEEGFQALEGDNRKWSIDFDEQFLSASLWDAGMTLSSSQDEALAKLQGQALAAANAHPSAPSELRDGLTAANRVTLAGAAAFLSPEQLEGLRKAFLDINGMRNVR